MASFKILSYRLFQQRRHISALEAAQTRKIYGSTNNTCFTESKIMVFFSQVCWLRPSIQSYKKTESEPKLNFVDYFLMSNDYKNLKNA